MIISSSFLAFKNISVAAKTWPCSFLEKTRVLKRYDLCRIGLAKVLEWCHIIFGLFPRIMQENIPNIAILPVKSPFHKMHGSHFVPVVHPFAALSWSGNEKPKCSTQKIESETCKRDFLIQNFTWPSWHHPRRFTFQNVIPGSHFVVDPWNWPDHLPTFKVKADPLGQP